MNWKTHIRKLSNKISRTLGILNRLKYILPLNIKLLIYNSLILSHLHYGILAWGYEHEKITKLQKKCLRILTLSDYKAHTEPLFKVEECNEPSCEALIFPYGVVLFNIFSTICI